MNYLSLLFIVATLSFAKAQDVSAIVKQSVPLAADSFIGVDEFKSLYFIKDNTFYKKETRKTYQFTDFSLGDITSVDILNPLKIVLFYQDTNTTVVLDNTLSEIRQINFNQISEFRTVQYATTAIDRNLWIYNLDLQQLELFDYNRNEVIASSIPISEAVLQQKSNYNFCWLQTKDGIQKYNIYGSLMNDYSIPYILTFAEKNGNLVIATTESLSYLAKGRVEPEPIQLPKFDVKQLYLDIENLYIYDGEMLHLYQLLLPKK